MSCLVDAALFRRGKCYAQLGGLDEAKADLKQVLKANEQDKAALALMKRVDAQLARQKAKAKKMAAKMFA